MRKFFEVVAIAVPTSIIFTILVFLFYIHTDIGFSETINGYRPIYAPAWLEVLVTIYFVPHVIGFAIYDYFHPSKKNYKEQIIGF